MGWYGSVVGRQLQAATSGTLLMTALLAEWCAGAVRVGETSPALLLATERSSPHLLPLKFWANPRQSALKPRKRDLHEPTLLALLGHDYDHRWMRTSTKPSQTELGDEGERHSVARLKSYLGGVELPGDLGAEAREALSRWLLSKATCHLSYTWSDLGSDFWPRWLRSAHCAPVNASSPSCSWPPGMSCRPGPARHLYILRWHCRLRKKSKRKKSENNVWTRGEKLNKEERRRRRRSKYRCLWIKVPYPVPEDCVCGC